MLSPNNTIQPNKSDSPGVSEVRDVEQLSVFDDLIQSFAIESLELLDLADDALITIERFPKDHDALNALFRIFHTVKGNAGFLTIDPCVATLAHEAENLLEKCRADSIVLEGKEFVLTLDCTKTLRILIECIGAEKPISTEMVMHVDTLIHQLGKYNESSGCSLQVPKTIAESNAVETEASGKSADAQRAPQESNSTSQEKKSVSNETIRVDRARLDQLVALVGELVIAQSMAQQDVIDATKDLPMGSTRSRSLGQLSRITRSLQELSLSLRMVPLRSTFQKMTRVARDLMRKLDKNVNFRVEGEQTELDKTVVDEIGDPLMHMVRNAIDHGIETNTQDRVSLGKPAQGQVTLRAFHQSGNIHIEIEDDGRGLNAEKLIAKARKLGLVGEDQILTEQEAFQLIFEPGFSTADKVTDVSGRGVGMDVVRRNIQALRGSIEIRSRLNFGSCFTIKLPLTLAIIDGMVVRAGKNRFVIPILSVTELMRYSGAQISTIAGKSEILSLRDKNVPLIHLQKLFNMGMHATLDESAIIVVVQDGEKTAALRVDEVLGQQQVVIKQLGLNMDQCPAVAGGAIMPDGQIGIILDIHGVIHAFDSETVPQIEALNS